jgi:hypothetical protein
MQMTTVFDGNVPASANPGVDPGAPVVVWTPTKSGIYSIILSAPDEPGAPFLFGDDVLVDMGAAIPGIIAEPTVIGNITDQFQIKFVAGEPLRLESFRGVASRAVVQVGVVSYADGSPVESGETKIVPLAVLKRALDIEADDDSFDQLLIDLESRAAAYVERMTARRWSSPIDSTKVIQGRGSRTLWLPGRIATDPQVVVVRERAIYGGVWEVLAADEYEIREGESLVRLDGAPWSKLAEYELSFSDGYLIGEAPQDIQDLVIDLVAIAHSGFIDDGVKQESIGDYSYTLDASVTAAATSLSDTSVQTMNRRRPLHV